MDNKYILIRECGGIMKFTSKDELKRYLAEFPDLITSEIYAVRRIEPKRKVTVQL